MESEEIRYLLWVGTAVMILLGCGLLFLGLYYQNHLARRKRSEAESLLKASLDSEQKERNRIAMDLHDGVQGDLSAVRNYLSVLQKQEEDPKRKLMLSEVRTGIDNALNSTKQISYNLMPPLLESNGIIYALTDYFTILNRSTGLLFNVSYHGAEICLDKRKQYELFRIFQEFATNMIKYGNITICQVSGYYKDDILYFEIMDDGVPYLYEDCRATSTGSGLRSIDMRLKIIGAQILQRKVLEGNHFLLSLK